MAREEVDRTWTVRDPGPGMDAALDRAIQSHGMTAEQSPDRLEMSGGSQVRMRLLGGLFVKDKVLPRSGWLERSDADGAQRFRLHLEDQMGMGLMDPGMHRKYQRILRSVAVSIEDAISQNAASVQSADDGTPDAD